MKRGRAIEDARRDELPIGTHGPRRHLASTLAEFTDVLRPERPYRMSARTASTPHRSILTGISAAGASPGQAACADTPSRWAAVTW